MEQGKVKKTIISVVKYGLSLALGVWLFWYLYSSVDMKEVSKILTEEINWWWIGLSLVVSVLSHVVRGFRWQLQLRSVGVQAPTFTVVNTIFGTYAVNLLLPRMGEVWRCGYLATREKASFTLVVGTMLSDRLADTVIVLLMTVAAFCLNFKVFSEFLTQYPGIKDSLYNMATSPYIYLGVAVCVAALVWLFTHKTENKFILKIKELVNNLWQGLASVWKMKDKWLFIIYSLLIWTCYFSQLYICFFAFPFTAELGIQAAFICFVLGSISMGVPVQGGLGAWHMAVIFGLSLYGVGGGLLGSANAEASAFALVVHTTTNIILVILLGLFAFASFALTKKKK